MNAYSLDLREKIVATKERGMPTPRSPAPSAWPLLRQTLRGRGAQEEVASPKKHPGFEPKLDEGARKLPRGRP